MQERIFLCNLIAEDLMVISKKVGWLGEWVDHFGHLEKFACFHHLLPSFNLFVLFHYFGFNLSGYGLMDLFEKASTLSTPLDTLDFERDTYPYYTILDSALKIYNLLF